MGFILHRENGEIWAAEAQETTQLAEERVTLTHHLNSFLTLSRADTRSLSSVWNKAFFTKRITKNYLELSQPGNLAYLRNKSPRSFCRFFN